MSKIPYDLTKIRGFVFDVDGVLSASTILLGDNGVPRRTVNTKDGYAMQYAVKKGLKISIITGAVSPGVQQRFNKLGIRDIFSGASKKLPILRRWLFINRLSTEEVIYVGDDIPDYECMRHVELSVAPADAAIDILNIARYISPITGGNGVAREVIEEVMKARGLWKLDEKAFGW